MTTEEKHGIIECKQSERSDEMLAVRFFRFVICLCQTPLRVRYQTKSEQRRCVGIGRRDRLKICCPRGRVGSSPTTGTNMNADFGTISAFFSILSGQMGAFDAFFSLQREIFTKEMKDMNAKIDSVLKKLQSPAKLIVICTFLTAAGFAFIAAIAGFGNRFFSIIGGLITMVIMVAFWASVPTLILLKKEKKLMN